MLDGALTRPDLEWFTTAAEKAAYLARLTASVPAATQQTSPPEGDSTRTVALPGTFPIGVESDGRTVLLYLATEVSTDAFRTFLQGHAELLRVAPTWTLRIIFSRPLARVYEAYQAVIHDELESPLQSATSPSSSGTSSTATRPRASPCTRRTRGSSTSGQGVRPRLTELYQRWLGRGDAVFEGRSSPVVAESPRLQRLALVATHRMGRRSVPPVSSTCQRRNGTDVCPVQSER
jgi:hypothetical protein